MGFFVASARLRHKSVQQTKKYQWLFNCCIFIQVTVPTVGRRQQHWKQRTMKILGLRSSLRIKPKFLHWVGVTLAAGRDATARGCWDVSQLQNRFLARRLQLSLFQGRPTIKLMEILLLWSYCTAGHLATSLNVSLHCFCHLLPFPVTLFESRGRNDMRRILDTAKKSWILNHRMWNSRTFINQMKGGTA